MMPGLVDGDFILVDKFRYGLRLPLTNTKVLSTWEPQHPGGARHPYLDELADSRLAQPGAHRDPHPVAGCTRPQAAPPLR